MTFTLPGVPLIYGGQESGADFQLPDRYGEGIDWSGYPLQEFYSTLISLKKEQPALWSGEAGGNTTILASPHNKVVLYKRSLNGEQIYIALNLAPDEKIITLSLENASRELFSDKQLSPSTNHYNDTGSFIQSACTYLFGLVYNLLNSTPSSKNEGNLSR